MGLVPDAYRCDRFRCEGIQFPALGSIDFEGAKKMATMSAVQPGSYGFPVNLKKRYDNFIGGEWVAPLSGQYFENVTPVTGQVLCEIARSNAADVDRRSEEHTSELQSRFDL